MADIQGDLEGALRTLTLEHLVKLTEYIPGPVKKRGSRDKLLTAYQEDPVFSIFGLDSLEYLTATLAGGTVTSIHRKIGDIYEASVKTIFMRALNLLPSDVTYNTIIRSGDSEEDRSADAYLQFDKLNTVARKLVSILQERIVQPDGQPTGQPDRRRHGSSALLSDRRQQANTG